MHFCSVCPRSWVPFQVWQDGTLAHQAVAVTWQLKLYFLLLSPGWLLPTLHFCSCMVSWIRGTNFLQHVVSNSCANTTQEWSVMMAEGRNRGCLNQLKLPCCNTQSQHFTPLLCALVPSICKTGTTIPTLFYKVSLKGAMPLTFLEIRVTDHPFLSQIGSKIILTMALSLSPPASAPWFHHRTCSGAAHLSHYHCSVFPCPHASPSSASTLHRGLLWNRIDF